MRDKLGGAPRGECDRCSFVYRRSELRRQMRYQGETLVDTGLLVCPTCHDVDHPFRTSRKLTDPVSIKDPRPPREGFIAVPTWESPTSDTYSLVWDGEQMTFDGDDLVWTG